MLSWILRFIQKFQSNKLTGFKILVVEDNPVDRAFMVRALEKDQYNVIYAENGLRGITMAMEFRPHLILLDYLLPDIDGLEVCRRLKEESLTREIPVIVISVVQDGLTMLRCYDAGAHNFVNKPINARELLREVALTLQDVKAISHLG